MTDLRLNSFQGWAKRTAEARGFTVTPEGPGVRLSREDSPGYAPSMFYSAEHLHAHVLGFAPPPPPRPRIRIVCCKCGSDNISRDAYARWDEDAQEWSLSSVQDFAVCEDCDAEKCMQEVPL